MTQLIMILKLILSLLPVIIEAVKALELALPSAGQGANKIGTLREILQGVFDLSKDAGVTFEQAWPAIEKTTAVVVSLFNKVGAFSPTKPQ